MASPAERGIDVGEDGWEKLEKDLSLLRLLLCSRSMFLSLLLVAGIVDVVIGMLCLTGELLLIAVGKYVILHYKRQESSR
jgi:hypothetical protein